MLLYDLLVWLFPCLGSVDHKDINLDPRICYGHYGESISLCPYNDVFGIDLSFWVTGVPWELSIHPELKSGVRAGGFWNDTKVTPD